MSTGTVLRIEENCP